MRYEPWDAAAPIGTIHLGPVRFNVVGTYPSSRDAPEHLIAWHVRGVPGQLALSVIVLSLPCFTASGFPDPQELECCASPTRNILSSRSIIPIRSCGAS